VKYIIIEALNGF